MTSTDVIEPSGPLVESAHRSVTPDTSKGGEELDHDKHCIH
jgi:hypothetical protein